MDYSSWDIGALVEYVLAFLALLVILIISLVTVHRRNDPLRSPFLWFKVAISLYFVWVLARGVQAILIVVVDAVFEDILFQIIDHLLNIDGLVESIADVFILLCLVELALSCLRSLGKDGVYHSIIRYSNLVIMVVLSALGIAALGTGEAWVIISNYGYGDGSNSDHYFTTTYNLLAAYSIIYWITALAVMSLSGFVLFISIRRKHLNSIAYLFISASLLNLVRSTYVFVYAVLYYINSNSLDPTPIYLIILDPILYAWFTVAMFGVLMSMGSKKLNGLWSQQPQLQPQQQGYSGGMAFYGRPELATGLAPTHMVYQHRHPSELSAPNYPVELGNTGYPPPNQYYTMQNPQQPQYVQHQMPNAGYAPAPAHYPTYQQPVEAQVNAAPTSPVEIAMGPSKSEQQSQFTPLH